MTEDRKAALLEQRIVALETAVSTLFGKNLELVEPKRPRFADRQKESATILVDAGFEHPAFYFHEARPGDGLPFRWFGNLEEATLTLPLPRSRPRRVEVHIAIPLNEAHVDGLAILCDGKEALTDEVTTLADGTVVKSAAFDAAAPGDQRSSTDVTLIARKRFDASAQGDPRMLGVGVHKIVVTEL